MRITKVEGLPNKSVETPVSAPSQSVEAPVSSAPAFRATESVFLVSIAFSFSPPDSSRA